MIVIERPADLLDRVGTHLGWSDWHPIEQADIDAFAAATGNQAPIHTDPEFAKSTPYGGTIAFGIQVLAMATFLMSDIWELRVAGGVDVGSNRVRHLSPVLAGGRVRVGVELAEAEPLDSGVRATLDLTFEVEGSERPACVAQIVFVYYF